MINKTKKLTLNKETLTDLELPAGRGGASALGAIAKNIVIIVPQEPKTRKWCTNLCTYPKYTTPDGPGGCI